MQLFIKFARRLESVRQVDSMSIFKIRHLAFDIQHSTFVPYSSSTAQQTCPWRAQSQPPTPTRWRRRWSASPPGTPRRRWCFSHLIVTAAAYLNLFRRCKSLQGVTHSCIFSDFLSSLSNLPYVKVGKSIHVRLRKRRICVKLLTASWWTLKDLSFATNVQRNFYQKRSRKRCEKNE